MTVTIKLQYDGDIRRFTTRNLTFKSLIRDIRSILNFKRSDGFKISYRDEDQDLLRVTSDLELEEAIRVAGNKTLVLQINLDADWDYSSDEEVSSAVMSTSPAKSQIFEHLQKFENAFAYQIEESVPISMVGLKIEDEVRDESKDQIPAEETIEKTEEKKEVTVEEQSVNETTNYKPTILSMRAKAGDMIDVDISDGGLAKFCLTTGQRVDTPKGFGIVRGTSLPDAPYIRLWIHLDGDKGISYWDDVINYDTMICKGIVPHFPDFTAESVASVTPEAQYQSAIEESMSNEKQRQIKAYYESLLKK